MKSQKIYKAKNAVSYLVEAVPVLAPILLAIFGSVSVLFLLFEKFQTLYILVVALPLMTIATVYVLKQRKSINLLNPGSKKEKAFVGVVVLIAVLAWVGFNARYNSQHVYTNRDPAIYAVAGAWLVDNETINIPRLPALTAIEGVKDTSAGFGVNTRDNTEIYAQGTHILPAFLGLFGRAVGELRMYPLNVVFGGVALLALYAFARTIVKPRWALVAMATLGASLPLLYFSRDTYTEPLALAFAFGGLALLVEGYRSKKAGMWLLAGVTVGASILTRIDAYMVVAFIVPFLGLYMAVAQKNQRASRARNLLLFIAGLSVVGVIGFLDVKYLSSGYFRDTWSLIKQELLLIVGLSFVAIIGILINWYTNAFKYLEENTRNWRALVCVGLLASLFIGFAIRPMVYDEYQNRSVAQVDGTKQVERVRSYKEDAPYWVAWYIGPIAMVLGAVGMLIMLARLLAPGEEQALEYVLLLGLVLCTALIYFVKPSIASDQIWASRRMLPVIMPGFLVACAFLLQEVYEGRIKSLKKYRINYQVTASILSTIVVFMPLLISMPFLDSAPFTQLNGVSGTCKAVPKNASILWIGLAKHEAPLTTRTFCDIPSVGYYPKLGTPDAVAKKEVLSQFAALSIKEDRVPIIGRFDDDPLVDTLEEKNSAIVADGSFTNVEYVKGRPPRINSETDRFIRLSIIKSDGSVSPLIIR